MASAERLKAVFGRYVTHPEFLGLELSDQNQRGAVDDTVLHLAARTGAIDDMKVLIDAGGAPLEVAELNKNAEIIRLLKTLR